MVKFYLSVEFGVIVKKSILRIYSGLYIFKKSEFGFYRVQQLCDVVKKKVQLQKIFLWGGETGPGSIPFSCSSILLFCECTLWDCVV